MRNLVLPSIVLGAAQAVSAQASLVPDLPPGNPVPTLEETRADMGIPSAGNLRGQKDVVGFASRPGQMAAVWESSAAGPLPEPLGPRPRPGVAGIICPHDDYLCTGRIYRQVVPLVTARTVILVGVFHRYRRYHAQGVMGFDPYRAWRSPDGDIPVSALRDEALARLDPGDAVREAAWHDSEHSLEAVAYWLRHQDPQVEILPVILPSAGFPRLQELAGRLAAALAPGLAERGWTLGRDLAVVISSDGTHYGEDFHYAPYGSGGTAVFERVMAADRDLLRGLLAGRVGADMARRFFETMVDPDRPDSYRMPWCGRFSVPFGLVLLEQLSLRLGLTPPAGMPIALGASVDHPELPVRALGMGQTCPINLHHFVTSPAVAFVHPDQGLV
jgi:AmmeMemoRadiSam system protein B